MSLNEKKVLTAELDEAGSLGVAVRHLTAPWLYRDIGKENGNYRDYKDYRVHIGFIIGDNGK